MNKIKQYPPLAKDQHFDVILWNSDVANLLGVEDEALMPEWMDGIKPCGNGSPKFACNISNWEAFHKECRLNSSKIIAKRHTSGVVRVMFWAGAPSTENERKLRNDR